MGAKTIKGITVEINGKAVGLLDSMKDITSQGTKLNKELKQIDKALKFDPGNVELLSQKHQILTDAVANTKEELEALENAQEQVSAQYASGQIDRGAYLEFQNKVLTAKKRLKDLEEQADETAAEIKKIKDEPIEDVDDASKKAKKSLGDAAKEAATFGDVLKAGAIIEGAKGIAEAVGDIVEETNEYRKIMGTLEVSSKDAGYTAEETQEAYKQLYGVLGDEQSAATALANLQALQLPQEELLGLINNSTGAWAKYGDSIPIDGLAESINETIRAGQVTGTFADVINWGSKENETFGVSLKENIEFTELSEKELARLTDTQREEYEATKAQYEAIEDWNQRVMDATSAEDYFNLALEACGDETERANLLMQAMKDQGLGPLADAWRETNADIVAANETQADFSNKAAEMAERVAPVVNEVKEGVNELVDVLLDATEGVDYEGMASGVSEAFGVLKDIVQFLVNNGPTVTAIIVAIAGGLAGLKVMSFVSSITGALKGVTTLTGAMSGLAGAFPALSGAFTFLSNPIGIAVAAIGAIIAVIVYLWNTNEEFREAVISAWEGIKTAISDFCQGIAESWGAFMDGLNMLGEGCVQLWEDIKSGVSQTWENLKATASTTWESMKTTVTTKWEQAKTTLSTTWEGMKSTASTALEAMKTTTSKKLENIKSAYTENGGGIKGIVAATMTGIKETQTFGLSFIDTLTGGKLTAIAGKFRTGMESARLTTSNMMENIRGTFATKIENARANIAQGLDNMRTGFATKLETARLTTSNMMENIRGTFATKIENARSTVSQGLDNIQSAFSSKLEGARSAVSNVMDNIKATFSEKIEAARTAIEQGISKIKNAFNFSWSLPHLSLPHISVSGGVAPYGIGGKGSLPKFHIEWYKEGGILNGAQIFGALGRDLLGGGEAGPEAVLPLRSFYAELERILRNYLDNPGPHGGGDFYQYNTYNSPKDLSPAECARQTRNETRKLLSAIGRG